MLQDYTKQFCLSERGYKNKEEGCAIVNFCVVLNGYI